MVELSYLDSEMDKRAPIYTRDGRRIPQLDYRTFEYFRKFQSVADVKRRTDIHLNDLSQEHRSQVKIRSFSPYMYNCVGMVFASRRAWIEIEDLDLILVDDNYRQISYEDADCGDIVIYSNGMDRSHVGMITSVERIPSGIRRMKVLSKWGATAEVEHALAAVPARYGQPTEFWSEKVANGLS